jgi:hypothetical protein
MHVHVQQHDINPLPLDNFDGFFAGFGFMQLQLRTAFQNFTQDFTKCPTVVRNQQLKWFINANHHVL